MTKQILIGGKTSKDVLPPTNATLYYSCDILASIAFLSLVELVLCV